MKLTRKHARRVLEVVDAGLVSGLGTAKPGKMCVEAAICFALDMPHGDQPGCVAACIRRYKIRINDASWSSSAARTAGMRRAAIAQLGSDFLDLPENRQLREEFVMCLAEQVIRQILPVTLRATALRFKDKIQAEKIVEAALRCENEGTREAALDAHNVCRAAYAAADAAADAYAAAAADAAVYAAAYAAADAYAAAAADAAADAYAAAAADAAADAYAAAAADAYAAAAADAAVYAAAAAKRKAHDEILNIAAEICVQTCIKFKTPGSKWLDLAPLKKAA
jgi:hypothetical protein